MACSACGVAASFNRNCAINPPGGNDHLIYFVEACQVASYTLTGGKITAITLDVGAVWRTIDARRFSVQATGSHIASNGAFLQTVTFQLHPLSDAVDKDDAAVEAQAFFAAVRNTSNGLVMIIEDRGGTRRCFGYTDADGSNAGLLPTEATYDSGLNLEDVAGYSITLTHAGIEPPVVDSALALPTV